MARGQELTLLARGLGLFLIGLLAVTLAVPATRAIGPEPSTVNLSPSFLLLSNWVNTSFLVFTGIPIPNASVNGLSNYEPTVANFYVGPLGLLPITMKFETGFSARAFLGVNNSIIIYNNYGELQLLAPPYSNLLLALVSSKAPFTVYVNFSTESSVSLNGDIARIFMHRYNFYVELCSNDSLSALHDINYTLISVNVSKGTSYIGLSLNSSCSSNVKEIINYNELKVNSWLFRSKRPVGLNSNSLAREYYISLLILKDDQNPYLGTFAASPSPLYLYSWVRDSSFAAMALQESGHLDSALKYWLWLLNATQYKSGVWFTRYDFYNGEPDQSFGIPELDSVGIVEVGIYQYFLLTHNITFLETMLPLINRSVDAQLSWILNSKFHLVPEDLSVWEDRLGYHFWTQAFNLIGLLDSAHLLSYLGYNVSRIYYAASLLNESIYEYFWNGSAFYSDLSPVVLYTPSGSKTALNPQPPLISSSALLPLSFNVTLWPQDVVRENVHTILEGLWNGKVGGLARFYGDDYHYNEDLFDSSGPMPPWIITTLFLGLYYSDTGNYTAALSLMTWAYDHSQNGLLPEAIDPNTGLPLPTTSPLTWSSAMYIILALSIKPKTANNNIIYYAVSAVALAAVLLVAYLLQRASARRIRSLEVT